jgi:hypothetical protein
MRLKLGDPIYTERLASFLESLGQSTIISGPCEIELVVPGGSKAGEMARREMAIYLRVWTVLYPDTEIAIEGEEDDLELPEARVVGAS